MKKIDWEIVANHLAGQANEEEETELAGWLAESEENRRFLDRLEKIWRIEQKKSPRIDTEKALQLVLSRIESHSSAERISAHRPPLTFSDKPIQQLLARPFIYRAAAVLAIAFGLYTLSTILTSRQDSESESVKFAGIQTLELGDGTRITFDAGSSFTYPTSFEGADKREVSLEGEAYFEVARDETRPFTLRANGGIVNVLGTSFAVRAWKSDEHVVVAVKEGRVSFGPEAGNDSGNVVYLGGNTMSRLLRSSGSLSPAEEIDFSRYVSWMKKEMYFRNAPVPEVLRQLERWYGVSFQVTDSLTLRQNVTVFIGNKPLKENLDLLSIILNMEVEQHADTVRFRAR